MTLPSWLTAAHQSSIHEVIRLEDGDGAGIGHGRVGLQGFLRLFTLRCLQDHV